MNEENKNITENQKNINMEKQTTPEIENKGMNLSAIIFPIAVVLIIGAFVGIILFNKHMNNRKEQQKKVAITGYDVKSIDDLKENYIKVGKYKGLQFEITQEMFDETVAEDTNYYETVDRKSTDGDSVSFNITGYVDGKKDKNITKKDQEVVVGEDTDGPFKLISDLVRGKEENDIIEGVTGIDPNELSEDGTDYTGIDVTYSIEVTGVSELVIDEVTDAWVKENFEEEGFTTTEDYYDYVKALLEEEVISGLWQQVLDGSIVKKYPEDAYARIVEEVDANFAYEADQWGMNLEEFYSVMQYTQEDVDKEYESEMASEMAAWVIAFNEDIYDVSEDEIDEWFAMNYEDYGYTSVEEMRQQYEEAEIVRAIVLQNVAEFVYDEADIIESYTIQ